MPYTCHNHITQSIFITKVPTNPNAFNSKENHPYTDERKSSRFETQRREYLDPKSIPSHKGLYSKTTLADTTPKQGKFDHITSPPGFVNFLISS